MLYNALSCRFVSSVDVSMIPFTWDPNGTVPNEVHPKLVRNHLAFAEKPLEPFHFGTTEGTIPYGTLPFGPNVDKQKEMEQSQIKTDMKIKDDSFVCFIISRAKYRGKLDFCD